MPALRATHPMVVRPQNIDYTVLWLVAFSCPLGSSGMFWYLLGTVLCYEEVLPRANLLSGLIVGTHGQPNQVATGRWWWRAASHLDSVPLFYL